ncbi:glycosyltransferase involved in cell wall biosynthesis [Rhizobium tibeticum]|uniref:rhamnosyltransferase WsaF family glycosyltransferase n=1 Tax=Rhizobium tibeticum TaxID=501024 RepID=UPI00277EA2BF|nr:glycosyltransferase family 1 protein [Rhizobium tibeticum]MDP9811471.1 glycosyltransferase involved in cell wall biosynthesis [Rhizobium tibeticum]
MARAQLNRCRRQIKRLVLDEGPRALTDKIRTKLSDAIRPKTFLWHVFPSDVLQADLSKPSNPTIPVLSDGEPIELNWIVGPAGPGSGGHTTIFRTLKYLQAAGYRNRVYFYDPYGGDEKYYQHVARSHYGLTCDIEDISLGMRDAHGVIATGWPTAYAAFNAPCAGKRFYFIQDYEPYFYPVGTNSALAETTYRMGFHGITAGRWLSDKLAREFAMETDWFPFGCDTARYRFDANSQRSGIAFYARAGTPRRAVEIGLLALELFAKRQPDIELHLFGQPMGSLPFKFTNHGLVSPDKLNQIYNKCFAGLSLSLTNVSLVPHEMLACGCLPIVNDADHNRIVLENANVRYAPLLPHALADALEAVVTMPDFDLASLRAAESVKSTSWATAGAAVDRALRQAIRASHKPFKCDNPIHPATKASCGLVLTRSP